MAGVKKQQYDDGGKDEEIGKHLHRPYEGGNCQTQHSRRQQDQAGGRDDFASTGLPALKSSQDCTPKRMVLGPGPPSTALRQGGESLPKASTGFILATRLQALSCSFT